MRWYVWYMCMCRYTHGSATQGRVQAGCQMSSSTAVHLIGGKQGVPLNRSSPFWLAWLASQLLGSTHLRPTNAGITGACSYTWLLIWVLRLQTQVPSCLPSKRSYPWKAIFTLNPPPQKTEHVPTESLNCISLIGMHLSDISTWTFAAFTLLISPYPQLSQIFMMI